MVDLGRKGYSLGEEEEEEGEVVMLVVVLRKEKNFPDA